MLHFTLAIHWLKRLRSFISPEKLLNLLLHFYTTNTLPAHHRRYIRNGRGRLSRTPPPAGNFLCPLGGRSVQAITLRDYSEPPWCTDKCDQFLDCYNKMWGRGPPQRFLLLDAPARRTRDVLSCCLGSTHRAWQGTGPTRAPSF